MSSKININKIIVDHIHTLRDYSKVVEYRKNPGKMKKRELYSKSDFFIFFILPIIISIFLLYFEFLPNDNTLIGLVTSLSIFSALLFNLLLIIYDIMQKTTNNKVKKELLREMYSNISFCILIAICTTIFAILGLIIKENIIFLVLSFLVYYLFTLFILTILMVLKRTHALLSREI